jgi:hypothetical protein
LRGKNNGFNGNGNGKNKLEAKVTSSK